MIEIKDYFSPTVLKRLDLDRSVFHESIGDFRAQIDYVLIDTDYNGNTFNISQSDIPKRKRDFIAGRYELELQRPNQRVAVKIVGMLGEETLVEG